MLIAVFMLIALLFLIRDVGADVDPETGIPIPPEETQEVWEFE
jgi:hypothetical protein